MKRMVPVLAAALLWGIALTGQAGPGWKCLKTEHFSVFYPPGLEEPARAILAVMEHYRPAVEELTGDAGFHLPVVLEDTGFANGFADPVFRRIHLYITPPGASSTLGATENWWSLVGVHEYVHALSLGRTGGLAGFLQSILGNLIIPNASSPGWLIEGIAVYGESQLSPYQGRLQAGFYEAYLAACAAEGRLPTLVAASNNVLAFPLDRSYLFGGAFCAYLAKIYGRDKFARFFEVNGSSLLALGSTAMPAWGIDASARRVYGKTFPQLWREWQAYEGERCRGFRQEGERLTSHGWYLDHPLLHGGNLYYQRAYPVRAGGAADYRREIVSRNTRTGEERILVRSIAPFALPMRRNGDLLYYGVAEVKPGFANVTERTYGHQTLLMVLELSSGRVSTVLAARMRAYEVLADGRILYAEDRRDSFGSVLRLFDPDTGRDRPLGEVDCLLEELAAEGGRIVAAARYDWANASLYELNLENRALKPLVDTPYLETDPLLVGDRLFFTANYGGSIAVYCYDFADGRVHRLTSGGYAANPEYDRETGLLYHLGLTADGFDIFRHAAAFTPYTPPASAPTRNPIRPLPEESIRAGGYWDNLRTLAPSIRLPRLEVNDNDLSRYGLYLAGSDAVGDFEYEAIFLREKETGSFLYDLNLTSLFWAPLQLRLELENDNAEELDCLTVSAAYPAHRQLAPGLSELTLGLSLESIPEIGHLSVTPSFRLGLRYPGTSLTWTVEWPLEEEISGFHTTLIAGRYMMGGAVTLRGSYFDDANGGELEIRGYDTILTSVEGRTIELEYALEMWRIESGLWNPGLYLNDLYLVCFFDHALARDLGQELYSYGLEVHLTGACAIYLPFDAYLRYARNDLGQEGLAWGISVGVPF